MRRHPTSNNAPSPTGEREGVVMPCPLFRLQEMVWARARVAAMGRSYNSNCLIASR